MKIEEAKTDLEKQIILWDGVIGIGVINHDGTPAIEIAVEKANTSVIQKLKEVINHSRWHGYDVIIVPTDNFKFHNK
jgi:hypothetical protein